MSNDLFSCRNCIHNPVQGLTLGRGAGFCLRWGSIIEQPERTTCKYLHRKDLPLFLVREAVQEHAEEFSHAVTMADLESGKSIVLEAYDNDGMPGAERLDTADRAIAAYHELESSRDATAHRRALTVATFAGAADGRKAIAHASLLRRALLDGGLSSLWMRRMLDLIDEVDADVLVPAMDIMEHDGTMAAKWEVAHARLSGVQELGWHLENDAMKYPMMELGAYAADEDWKGFLTALGGLKQRWRDLLIAYDVEAAILHTPHSRVSAPQPPRRFNFEDKEVKPGESNTFRMVH
jgi:hypothetical protein